jgi:AcrR family transcriptional regulator
MTFVSESERTGMMSATKETHQTGRDRQREQTRRRVYESALALFRRDGAGATSIDDIVKSAAVSRGTFYFHFATKEDVLLELLRESEERVIAALAKVPASGPVTDLLDATAIAIAREWEHDSKIFPDVGTVALRRTAANLSLGRPEPIRARMGEAFRLAVERGELTPALPSDLLADVFLLNVFAAALAWCARPELPLETVLRSAVGLFLTGAGGK